MLAQHVTAIPFRGLANCFSPPGIPLIQKARGAVGTTSVLVRGRAGTGKSTLALAVAHAVAEATGGIVLYLITEAAFSDVEYKSELVGLGQDLVSWEAAVAGEKGKVAACHLLLEHPQSANAESAQTLSSDALKVALELLTRNPSVQVRALVIDSLPLPEGKHDDRRLGRNDLVGFLQLIEDLGVSPVLIEETDSESTGQMTFPVDLVFELAMAPNPDTGGGLMRQLIISKCRYSDSTPGPHDTVLEDGVPVVWPLAPNIITEPRKPLGFFMPLPSESGRTRIVSMNRSGLVLALHDKNGQSVVRAWNLTPGLRQIQVRCGPTITLTGPDEGQRNIPTLDPSALRTIPISHGPSALAWVVLEMARSTNANAIVFTGLEYLLAKPRYSLTLPELLNRLVRLGLMVMAQGTSTGLGAIHESADFTGPTGHLEEVTTPLARDFRCASLWGPTVQDIDLPQRRSATPNLNPELAFLLRATDKMQEKELSLVRRIVQDIVQKDLPKDQGGLFLRHRIDRAWLLHCLGMTRTALRAIQNMNSDDPNALTVLGWALAEMGDLENACRVALRAIDTDAQHPEAVHLWRVLRARFTAGTQTLEPTLLAARLWVEAAAIQGEVGERLDKFVNTAITDNANLLERILADARMASHSSVHWKDAQERYQNQLADDTLSMVDRADILFNLGVIHERLGERDAAFGQFRKAIGINPLHEPAHDRLESFGFHRLTLASSSGKDSTEGHAFHAVAARFSEKQHGCVEVSTKVYEHEEFKENLEAYLNGPDADDVVPWIGGVRLSVEEALVNLAHSWELTAQWLEQVRKASADLNETNYIVPFKTYVWAFYYRKSLWKERGYWNDWKEKGYIEWTDRHQIKLATWSDFKELAKKMADDHLTPIAFGNREDFPAAAVFDILDMRMNGFDFHERLLKGEEGWNTKKVRSVFERWREMIPFYSEEFASLSYKHAIKQFIDKKAGMCFMGGFFTTDLAGPDVEDIGVFPFPMCEKPESEKPESELKELAVDAPIDGFVLTKKFLNPRSPECEEMAKEFIRYLGSQEAFAIYDAKQPGMISVNTSVRESDYGTELQRRTVQMLTHPKAKLAIFLSRRLGRKFANSVVVPGLASFLRAPSELDRILTDVQDAWKHKEC